MILLTAEETPVDTNHLWNKLYAVTWELMLLQ